MYVASVCTVLITMPFTASASAQQSRHNRIKRRLFLRRNNRDDCSFKLVAEGQGVGRSVVHYADPAYAFGQDCAACGAMAIYYRTAPWSRLIPPTSHLDARWDAQSRQPHSACAGLCEQPGSETPSRPRRNLGVRKSRHRKHGRSRPSAWRRPSSRSRSCRRSSRTG